MIGAIIGDTIGSSYEFDNVKSKNFEFFTIYTNPTDDSFMTIAVAETLINNLPIDYSEDGLNKIKKELIRNMVKWYNLEPDGGYGGMFLKWLHGYNNRLPYNSFGNGSAMRISSVAWIANTLDEVKILSKTVSEVSHNHPEGIKGAEAIAVSIFLARNGKDKEYIKNYISKNYYPNLLKLDYEDLVKNYEFNETCQGSVPQAIYCFLISKDFEDCIRTSISIGGDSDTIAAMACSIAEAYYKNIPLKLIDKVRTYLTKEEKEILDSIKVK